MIFNNCQKFMIVWPVFLTIMTWLGSLVCLQIYCLSSPQASPVFECCQCPMFSEGCPWVYLEFLTSEMTSMTTSLSSESLKYYIKDIRKWKNQQKSWNLFSIFFTFTSFVSFVAYPVGGRTRYLQNRCSLIRWIFQKSNQTSILNWFSPKRIWHTDIRTDGHVYS